jgi:hypothetical protein
MSKHTQGKWFWIGETLRYKQDGDHLTTNGICWRGRILFHSNKSKEETQANRNLIASAPEMLKSLGLAVEEAKVVRGYSNIKPDSTQEQILNNLINRCSSLIAKAEGGAK